MKEEKHKMVEKPEEGVNPIPFEKTEETKENPEEEETSETEEETPQKETETPEKTESPKEEYTDREKRYYARMKKAEEDAKTAKAEVVKSKQPVSDVDAILEVQSATKDLDNDEVAELKIRATATGKSLSEARNDENFALWQTAYKAKVDKEKALNPSTTQTETEKEESRSLDQRLNDIKEKYKGDNAKIQEENSKVLAELRYKDPITGGMIVGMSPIQKR